jgi:hypothetical protein
MKMQIVIDIDEDLYKSIIAHRCKTRFQQRCDYEDLKNAIEDGTLLPKHGRLIDADALWKKWVFDAIGKQEIDDAPTIIEADRSDEE